MTRRIIQYWRSCSSNHHTIKLSYYSCVFSFFCRIISFIYRALSRTGLPVLRAKLDQHPQWVFIATPETIHLDPDFVIRIDSKKSDSESRVWKVILFWLWIFLSIPSMIHSCIWTFSPAHPRAIRKQETSVMPRACQSEMVCGSNIIMMRLVFPILSSNRKSFWIHLRERIKRDSSSLERKKDSLYVFILKSKENRRCSKSDYSTN